MPAFDAAPPAPGACCPTGAAVAAADGGAVRRWAREIAPGRMRVELMTPAMTCGDCIRRVEGAARAVSGVFSARANLSLRRVAIEYDPARADPDALLAALAAAGYAARPFDAEAMRDVERDAEGRDLLARLAVAGRAIRAEIQ